MSWLNNPDEAAKHPRRVLAFRRRSREGFTRAMVGLAMPFGALAIAFIVDTATQSEHVFVVVFAVGLALGLGLRFTVLR